jgi:hypothetical protein
MARAKFISTWAAPGAEKLSFLNKKVVTLVVSQDEPLRMSAEEALAEELTKRGVQGAAAYRVIPREELRDAERAKGWFEKAGAAGAVAMRLVDLSKETTPAVVAWSSAPYYSSFWNYYPYSWGASFAIGPGRSETRLVIETLVFDLTADRLIWAGTSETTNPKSLRAAVHDIVDATADEMRKKGLTRK